MYYLINEHHKLQQKFTYKVIDLGLSRIQDKNMLGSPIISQSDRQKEQKLYTLHETFRYFFNYQIRLYSSKAFRKFFQFNALKIHSSV